MQIYNSLNQKQTQYPKDFSGFDLSYFIVILYKCL